MCDALHPVGPVMVQDFLTSGVLNMPSKTEKKEFRPFWVEIKKADRATLILNI